MSHGDNSLKANYWVVVMGVSIIQCSNGCLQDYGRDVSFSLFCSPPSASFL